MGLMAGLFLAPAAADAHSEAPTPATNYLTRITSMTPRVSGLSVRVIRNGMWLELSNRTGRTVEVLGYSGEPYLRITPQGTYANLRSPSVYIDSDVDSDLAPDDVSVSPQATPSWQRVSGSATARWHDHRTHWMGEQAPPVVTSHPHRAHRLSHWMVPLRVSTSVTQNALASSPPSATTVELRGTLDYLPPPRAGEWYAAMAVGFALLVGLGLVAVRRRIGPHAMGAMLSAILLVAVAAELVDSVGRVMDLGATGFGIVTQLLATKTYGTLSCLAALATIGFAIRGHAGALLSLALSGGCLAVLGGLADVEVFSRSRATLPWSGEFARGCTSVTLVLGLGVAATAWLMIRSRKRENSA